MKIRYAAKTDVGMKRTHNEDYFSLMEDEQLFIVADGMGGHSSGEVASRMAAETVSEFYQRTKDEEATWPYKMDRSLSYIENRLVCGIKLANYKIYEAASKDIRFKGMGTTIVTCLINGDKIYVSHVGDSRCYRVRNNGGNPWRLTVLAQGDLIDGAATVDISHVSWTATPAPPFQNGTLSKTVEQVLASGTGDVNPAQDGSVVFQLANSWTYSSGSYSQSVVFTLVAP